MTNDRGLQTGNWNGVPYGCSTQYENNDYDQSPHSNTKTTSDNGRVTNGEFRKICKINSNDSFLKKIIPSFHTHKNDKKFNKLLG